VLGTFYVLSILHVLFKSWLMYNLSFIVLADKATDVRQEDVLVFVTGADKSPPMGFHQNITLMFYNREPG
jgi:hypothetical protein